MKLKASMRKSLPKGWTKSRPPWAVRDPVQAKAGPAQMVNRGKLSAASASKIRAKANALLSK